MKGNFYALRRLLSSFNNFSPQLILISTLFFSFTQVNAKTVVIGSGSGTVSQTSMSGLNPGDILAIAPGTYSGGNFSNLSGITITSQSSRVTFTGTVTFGSNVNCNFSFFTFLNVAGAGISWPGGSSGCKVNNISFSNVSGNAIDAASGFPYNGSISSFKMYNCTFDSLSLYQTAYLLRGSYGQINNNADFCDSVIMTRIKIDQTITNGEQVRGVFFRLYVHDWKVTYSGNPVLRGDVGIFTIYGNINIHNLLQSGGAGYIARVFNASLLGTPRNTYLYNTIKQNAIRYGFIDIRIDATNVVAGLSSGTNCYIWNNTALNCTDDGGYIAPMVVLGLYPGYVCEVKNNLGINLTANSLAQTIIQNNSGGSWTVDTSNNRYYASASGIIDPSTCVPVTSSPVIGKGITIPSVKDDYYHTVITGAYDIGAVQTNGVAAQPPPPNQPPVANAGNNQTITLPTNSIVLDGTKSVDPDGTIVSYIWSQVSGGAATITNGTTASTLATGLTAGTYIFKLVVTDNGGAKGTAFDTIVVKPAANIPPTANAGADQTITLPVNSVNVNGSASIDADGTIASYSWSQVSGPSAATIANPAAVTTNITNLVQGTYVFKLLITDNNGATDSDSLNVTVNAAVNQAPVANAGSSKSITLPVNSVNLDGTLSSDPDGTIASYSWAQITGPSAATIINGNTATPTASALLAGQYTFELTVTDNKGATGKAQVKITVIPAGSLPPVANAGADQTITLPTNSVNLDGSASVAPSGTITNYSWTQSSGPSAATIASPSNATTTINNLVQGTYIFKLVITDNISATAADSVIIKVNPAPNKAPIANAGVSKTITLPVNSVNLDGTLSSDPDGTIASYSWAQIAGPTAATITNGNTAAPTAGNLQVGQYTFELTVTDNKGATAKAQVNITVLAAPNQAPVANAGTDQTITLPVSTANLNGTLSADPDGTIVSYSWNKISGTGAITITNSNTATPTAIGLQAGIYVFELTVTDNKGATAKDQVTITVNASTAANQAPVANAGTGQTITLPVNTANLNGTNSFDPDGTIAAYSWVQISGPTTASITGANTGTPVVGNLIVGQYIFELTVTDNKGATAKDRVIITVNDQSNKPNLPPVANAGVDTTIVLPATSAVLDGSASLDSNGTITNYQWQEVSGPNSATLSSFSNAVSTVSNLVIGEYIFQLTVTDNNGSTATASVKVKVVDNLRSLEQILLYPNPAHDVVNLRLISDSGGTVRVNIYDMNGRLVQATQMEKQESFFDQSIIINRLAGGMYTLQAIIGTNKILLSKFIKQ